MSAEHDAIVKHVTGPARVIAGPGCGKTRACVDRAALLYRVVSHPSRVLCVTFSVEAAAEMRRRIARKTGFSEKTLSASVSTFHSIAFRILREEGLVEGRDAVIPRREQLSILKQIGGFSKASDLCKRIAQCNRTLDEADGAIEVREFRRWLLDNKKVAFDSMVYFAVMHLRSNQAAREKWQSKFAFVIVDEAHDCSPDQIEFARLLAAPENNVMFVYDPSQSIYSFRGAEPSILRGLENLKTFYLSENHRSGAEIIAAFTPFAEKDDLSQELVNRMRPVRELPACVVVTPFAEDQQEAHGVAMEICIDDMRCGESAILSRTRAELLPYAEELRASGIPYNWRGVSFWEERDIVKAISYLEYCANPAKGIPAKTPRFLHGALGRLADIAAHCVPADLLRSMRGEMGIGLSFDEERADDFAQENYDALIRRAESFKTISEFLADCRAARLVAKSTQGVTLSTIHSAKGLEWKNVFLVGMGRDRMPHPKSVNPDEERRLVYVALSRAKEYLWASYSGEPSVFVETLERRKNGAAA